MNLESEKILQRMLVSEPYFFARPKGFVGNLKQIVGEGILAAEGEVHKKQRKLMSPAFSNVNIKVMMIIIIIIIKIREGGSEGFLCLHQEIFFT